VATSGLPEAIVHFYDEDGWELDPAITDEEGRFVRSGLPEGSYTIYFEPPYGSDLAPEWYDNVQEREDATAVEVEYGDKVVLEDAMLSAGGAPVVHPVLPPRSAYFVSSVTLDTVEEYVFRLAQINDDSVKWFSVKASRLVRQPEVAHDVYARRHWRFSKISLPHLHEKLAIGNHAVRHLPHATGCCPQLGMPLFWAGDLA